MTKPDKLDYIHGLKLDAELARTNSKWSEGAIQDRIETTLHEAAHLVAAIRHRSYVNELCIWTNKRARGFGGYVKACADDDVRDAFEIAVGYAWDWTHSRDKCDRSDPDLFNAHEYATRIGVDFTDLLIQSRKFTIAAANCIELAARGILAVIPKNGRLNGQKLQRLIDWLEPHVDSIAWPSPPGKCLFVPGFSDMSSSIDSIEVAPIVVPDVIPARPMHKPRGPITKWHLDSRGWLQPPQQPRNDRP